MTDCQESSYLYIYMYVHIYVCYEKKYIYVYMYAYMGIYIHIKVAVPLFRVTAPQKKYAFEERVALFVLKLIVWKG